MLFKAQIVYSFPFPPGALVFLHSFLKLLPALQLPNTHSNSKMADGDALGGFFTAPVILAILALVIFLIGAATLIRIYSEDERSDGKTMPM